MAVARPAPVFWALDEARSLRILMDVIELVREVASSPADEIEIASLPDWAWAVPNFGQSETRLGFQVAHDFWQRYGFWVKKQVCVVGHDDIAIKGEIVWSS